MLQTYEYDRNVYGGPPAPIDKSEIDFLFSTWADVTEIDRCTLDRSRATSATPPYPDSTWELTLLIKRKEK